MFKNYARIENEIHLRRFGLYAALSCSLNGSNCHRQARRAARCQHHRVPGHSSDGTAENLSEPKDRQAQGRLQNEIHRARIFVGTENYILPTKASSGNLLLLFKFSCLYYTCFLLPGATLTAPLALRADTFSAAENTKEAEILSITWR